MRLLFLLHPLVLLLVMVRPSSAQTGNSRFQHWGVEHGLSQGSVTTIVQDHKGFMWIGTLDGLNRFDGVEFKKYHHEAGDSTSLSGSMISCLYVDSDSNLWIGTFGGLNRFDRARNCFIRYKIPQGGRYNVTRVAETRDGNKNRLWVTDGSLYFLDPASEVLTPHQVDIPASITLRSPALWDMHAKDEMLWLSGDNGFFRLDPRRGKVDHVEGGFNHSIVSFLIRDHECWVGSEDGLFRYDMQTGQRKLQSGFPTGPILQDRDGQIWAGTAAGLEKYTSNPDGGMTRVAFTHDENSEASLSNDHVRSLYEDASGALWIGTYNGLNRLDDYSPQFTVYRHRPQDPNSLGFDFVLPIMEAQDGKIWFGTFGDGIWVFQNENDKSAGFVHFTQDSTINKSLCGNNVRSILQDRTGVIWIGTDKGVSTYDPRTNSFTCHPMRRSDIRASYWVEALHESRDGTLWLGVNSLGIIRFDPRQMSPDDLRYPDRTDFIEARPDSKAILSLQFRAFIEDRFNHMWVGTEFGLIRIDPETGSIRRYLSTPDDSMSLSHNSILSIYEDPTETTHVLWIGTNEGLNRFEPRTGKSRRFMKQEGFPSPFVYGILRDDWGRLWLSTNHGISRFDDRQPDGRKFKNYDVSDGLPGNEFNRNSFYRLKSGEFLFGSTRGVVRFDPLRMRDNPYSPPVVITAFQKFGNLVRFDREVSDIPLIELKPDENVFSFEFVALNFTNSSKNQYAYKMEGVDKDWVFAGTRRYAGYTHLDPGSYTFRVKASNNDGVWNEQGTSIDLMIHPPYWQTLWFRLIAAMLLLSVGPIIYFRKVAQLRSEKLAQQEFSRRLIESQESERKRIARELHDGIGQNLLVMKNNATSIRFHQPPDPEITERLSDIAGAASDALAEIREITGNLRPFMLDKFGLDEAIRSLIDRVAQSSEIDFAVAIGTLSGCLPKEQEINFFRVVQEAVNNILKHSKATKVSISIQRLPNRLVTRIEDDGRGFLPEDASPGPAASGGFGLRSMAERMKILEGTMHIDSAPGSGTKLSFEIPIQEQVS